MIPHKLVTSAVLLTLIFTLAACSGSRRAAPADYGTVAPPPARIGHIVFIELKDQRDFHALLKDADWMLGTIPTVSTFAAGKHLDTGRSTVRSDYDLAIYLGFESEQDLSIYVAHPKHIDFVNKWKPRLSALRVYDMIDWPTTRAGYME
ncbi:MAG: Dabb family protein [Phycisphaerales bacterium]|nr:Dabb family protein [Phycisphaerales bacterium]